MIEINDETRKRIRALFPESSWDEVETLLRDRCGDSLPLVGTPSAESAERIRFAVLKLSAGNMESLENAVRDAAVDWRDVLVSADFADDTQAHREWSP